MSRRSTTYAKGEDPRNMNRSTLTRHLRTHVTGTPESKTIKRRVYDDWTTGWKVEWTDSRDFETRVRWVRGPVEGRYRSVADRNAMRDAALDEIEAALEGLGYVTKRGSGCLLVLRRMGG